MPRPQTRGHLAYTSSPPKRRKPRPIIPKELEALEVAAVEVAKQADERQQTIDEYDGKYDLREIALALLLSRGIVSTAAQRLGCRTSTVSWFMERYPEVEEAARRGRELRIDLAEQALDHKVAQGDIVAILFTLKTQGKDRGYVERRELDERRQVDLTVRAIDYREALAPLAPPSQALEAGDEGGVDVEFRDVPPPAEAPIGQHALGFLNEEGENDD